MTADQAHWFGVDQLSVCVHGVTLKAHQGHWFGIDQLRACVHGEH